MLPVLSVHPTVVSVTALSLHHIVHSCAAYHELAGKPCLHELGENFALLGIVEHPFRLSQFRLNFDLPSLEDAVTFYPEQPCTFFWTDGSVVAKECYWTTTAAFAVVDQHGSTIWSGRVRRWAISSYAAELWDGSPLSIFPVITKRLLTIALSCSTTRQLRGTGGALNGGLSLLQCSEIE